MLLPILLGLQIIGNFLVGVESVDELGKRNVSDNEVDKRDENGIVLSETQLNILLSMYDKASVATFTYGNVIPDPRCQWPFDYWLWNKKKSKYVLYSQYNYCRNDGGTEIWCSKKLNHESSSSPWEYCLMKGAEVADPKKWKPHEDCVPIFSYYNPKYKKEMYYKGCTNIDEEKPWCAHKYRHESNKWSFCINIEKKWAEWSHWSQCPQTCGGSKTRTRECQQTGKPSSGCPGGVGSENIRCLPLCPINGGWSEWSPYSTCSKTCGFGRMTKTRECNNPEPQYGGKDCDQHYKMREPCKLAECPNDRVEDNNGKLSKMSNKGGFSIIYFAMFGSIGGLILIAAVIAGVMMYRKKKMLY